MAEPVIPIAPARLRRRSDAEHYAAIIESCEDAILSTNLAGVLESWNPGAERLFGYRAEEAIGQSVMMLIPADRLDEESVMLSRIQRGERVAYCETVRRRKDGSRVDVALTVSAIRDASGRIIGASKIARDITERRQVELQRSLLLQEMDHRIKNLFTLAGALVTLSANWASTPRELIVAVGKRLAALARAHALTLSHGPGEATTGTTLHVLIGMILSPFDGDERAEPVRFSITGADFILDGSVLTSFALILHELATNSAKYGALARPTGRVEISCHEQADRFMLTWVERGGPPVTRPDNVRGFGSYLLQATSRQLGGNVDCDWNPEGVTIRLSVRSIRFHAYASRKHDRQAEAAPL